MLQIVAENTTGPPTSRPIAPPSGTSGFFVPRNAVSRPRAGLGSKQRGFGTGQAAGSHPGAPAAGRSASSANSSGGAKGQDDFRKMLLGGK